MPVTLKENELSSLICLEGAIDIALAGELKGLLLQALQSGKEVRIGLDGATNLDVTAIQLLWAARREAKSSGVRFSFEEHAPAAVISRVRDAGVEDFIASANGIEVSGGSRCQA